MNPIYFDNAATTPIDPLVLEAMMPYLTNHFGNPSSIYSYGRETKMAIEKARKTVASLLQVVPSNIFFTSGGTEATNTAIRSSVQTLGCTTVITSTIEHHATLHTVECLEKEKKAKIEYVHLLQNGQIDLDHLEALLKGTNSKKLVTLMHANNEVGNITDIATVGYMCDNYEAIFHSDCVQTVGHYPFDAGGIHLHYLSSSAHKFHGPKGVGFLYAKGGITTAPLITGGGQERGMRSGTENVYGIVGMAKALELANARFEEDIPYITNLKKTAHYLLSDKIKGIMFNGDTFGDSLYNIINFSLPKTPKSEMLVYNLDINHICVSSGSACSSGTNEPSLVAQKINGLENMINIRLSFSRNNTKQEVEFMVDKITELL